MWIRCRVDRARQQIPFVQHYKNRRPQAASLPAQPSLMGCPTKTGDQRWRTDLSALVARRHAGDTGTTGQPLLPTHPSQIGDGRWPDRRV